MIWIHAMCLLGPATYNPMLAAVSVPAIVIFGLGIEMVYHRMLCHKAFASPKWWEYTMAYFGVLNIQVGIVSNALCVFTAVLLQLQKHVTQVALCFVCTCAEDMCCCCRRID